MPVPGPFSHSVQGGEMYPALYLYPINDSFAPKHIALLPNQRVKIGRQTNAKTTPGERNGYFDSKVLSRQHAEVWEDGGKIFIKDVKSSNGTFINGERLSAEGMESDPFELKSDDIVEFGIDIVGEDNKTIVHHKVAARVLCVMTEQDAQAAARAEQHSQQQQFQPNPPSQPAPTSTPSSFNFGAAGPGAQSQRRPMGQALTGMGGMGGSMRPPGKSGLTFDHILSRLQGELQKSRETGAELHTLTGAMSDIHDTLGGTLPPSMPPYPHSLPAIRPNHQQPQPQHAQSTSLPNGDASSAPSQNGEHPTTSSPESGDSPPGTAVMSELQSQLHETQSSLSSHVDRIRALEGALAEQESIKREVRVMRDMMEHRRRELASAHGEPRASFDDDDDDMRGPMSADDDDDAHSISTIIPHELERVDEEEELLAEGAVDELDQQPLTPHPASDELVERVDEDDIVRDRERDEERREEQSIGRPRTPEPNGLGLGQYGADKKERERESVVDDVTNRLMGKLEKLTGQLESALELSSTLQAQHAAAQTTISALENKVEQLEGLVKTAQTAAVAPSTSGSTASQDESEVKEGEGGLKAMLNEWKKTVEGQWSSVQEEWKVERERLAKAREEWEAKTAELAQAAAASAAASASDVHNATKSWALANGDYGRGHGHEKRNGLVTPPSPRSLSADSAHARRPRRRRGRGRSRSGSGSSRDDGDGDTDATLASDESGTTKVEKEGSLGKFGGKVFGGESGGKEDGSKSLVTPESSLRSLRSGRGDGSGGDGDVGRGADGKGGEKGMLGMVHSGNGLRGPPMATVNMQTAVGVVVLGVAAAAVIWRVKPVGAVSS